MAASELEQMDITQSEGNLLYEQDRKKFNPMRAIRKMFRGKKKPKELSKSLGSILLQDTDEGSSAPVFERSVSHESVFAKEGVTSLRNALSVGDVTGGTNFGRVLSANDVSRGTDSTHELSADEVAGVTVSINRLKDSDEAEAVKTANIESDVNQITSEQKKIVEAKDVETDLNMNDIAVNVSRLDNKAAYDKIALRPKRRPARNARGVQQQNVVRTRSQINGFAEVDASSKYEEPTDEEAVRDGSPPRVKKPRMPAQLSLQSPKESGNNDSGEGSSATPKRYSMLGRSPVGPGPGMIVPSLQDVKNFKLRKTQSGENDKRQEKVQERVKSGEKSKSFPPKAEKAETPKKVDASKKTKVEQKSGTEGSSSNFPPWKSNLKSSTTKSPVPGPNATESSKESENPANAVILAPKTTKKSGPEKESKVSSAARSFAEAEKRESPKIEGLRLGKSDKNHSGNYSKGTSAVVMDVAEKKTTSLSSNSPVCEKATEIQSQDVKANVSGVDSKEKRMSEKRSADQQKTAAAKHDGSVTEYAEKPRKETGSVRENKAAKVNEPRSPDPAALEKNLRSEDGKTRAVIAKTALGKKGSEAKARSVETSPQLSSEGSNKIAEYKVSSPTSPVVAEKPKFIPRKAGNLSVNVTKSTKAQPEQSPKASSKATSPSTYPEPRPAKDVKGTDREKKETLSSPRILDADAKPQLGRTKSTELKEVAKVISPTSQKASGTLQSQSLVQTEEGKSKTFPISEEVSAVVTSLPETQVSAESEPNRNPGPRFSRVGLTALEGNVSSAKASDGSKLAVQTSREQFGSKKTLSLDRSESPPHAEKKGAKAGDEVARRIRSLSARTADVKSPIEIYSRDKLKPVGDHVPYRKTASANISPATATTAPRPRSVDINPKGLEKPHSPQSTKPEKSKKESPKVTTPSDKPNQFNEKPKSPFKTPLPTPAVKVAVQSAPNDGSKSTDPPKEESGKKTTPVSEAIVVEKPKLLFKAPLRTPSVDVTVQSAADGVSKSADPPKKEPKKEKTTPVSEHPKVARQRTNSKPNKDEKDASEDGVPAWVQMARRRSKKVLDEGARKNQKPVAEKAPAPADDGGKEDGRPKTLPVASKQRENPTAKAVAAAKTTPTPTKSNTTPVKSSTRTPSGRVQNSRTAAIPAISVMSETKRQSPAAKQATPSGQPSWLAIAVQKQKTWAKEETV